MAAQILDGLALAGRIRGEVVAGVRELMAKGHRPKLAAILVGQPQAGLIYAKSQRTQCDRANIDYELHRPRPLPPKSNRGSSSLMPTRPSRVSSCCCLCPKASTPLRCSIALTGIRTWRV